MKVIAAKMHSIRKGRSKGSLSIRLRPVAAERVFDFLRFLRLFAAATIEDSDSSSPTMIRDITMTANRSQIDRFLTLFPAIMSVVQVSRAFFPQPGNDATNELDTGCGNSTPSDRNIGTMFANNSAGWRFIGKACRRRPIG